MRTRTINNMPDACERKCQTPFQTPPWSHPSSDTGSDLNTAMKVPDALRDCVIFPWDTGSRLAEYEVKRQEVQLVTVVVGANLQLTLFLILI